MRSPESDMVDYEEGDSDLEFDNEIEQYDGSNIISEHTLPQPTARLLKTKNYKLMNNNYPRISNANMNGDSKLRLKQE